MEILPDSRLKRLTAKGFVGKWGLWWIQVFCANCGANGGFVPEETTTHFFYLCPKCYEVHGVPAGCMVEPDHVFWEQVNAEMEEKYGRVLTPVELQAIIDADSSPLASLMKEGATNLKGA